MFETRELAVFNMYFNCSEVLSWAFTPEPAINLSALSPSFST